MEEVKKSADGIRKENGINYSLHGGKAMACITEGEEIVISGISGCFPNSNNIHELKENLVNKVNMVLPNRRWQLDHPEIPKSSGTIPEIEQYDAGFFGVHEKQSHSLDAMIAMFQEKSIEAIFDAGIHPSDLENTKTGVFVGTCFSENDKTWFFDKLGPKTYAMTGSERCMIAHRLSYFLKLKGPSYTTDTACSSSLYALEQAYRALRMGEIDYAIVGGSNLCLHPFVSLQFARLGVLSKDGSCKSFDEQGNGYARSESIGVLFLQKSQQAKRIYCELVHVKTNCDGYKEQGITFPSKIMQRLLLNEFYDECGVDKYSLSFLEAHGTGTQVGDPEECSAIDDVFTKGRTTPLLIGSVKSNIGHSEPTSGICSIIKCIIGMETGFIPPNIHYNKPRPEIKGLVEGRMKVVTENTPFEDDRGLIGVNSFGFGGGNCHVLLRWNSKNKTTYDIPEKNLPRLVCLSGRTEEAVMSLLDSVVNKFDPEYIKLLHDGFRKNVENHVYRGYTVVSQLGEIARSTKSLRHYFPSNSPPLYVAFGELNNWYSIGCDLMALPAFFTYIEKIQEILVKQKVNILDAFLKKSSIKNIGNVLGSMVVQLGLIDLLNLTEVKPTGKLGYSYGQLCSAYNDKSFSLEDTITYASVIDKVSSNISKSLESNNNNCEENHISNGNNLSNGTGATLDYIRSLKNKNFTTLKYRLLQNVLKELSIEKSDKDKTRLKNIVDGILSSVFENTDIVTANSVILKIGDGPLDQVDDVSIIPLFSEETKDYLTGFLKTVGSLYEIGYNPQVSKLYPYVSLPVSRGTEMISPYIRWNHRKPKTIPRYRHIELASSAQANHGGRTVNIEVNTQEWSYIKGHVVDGRNLFPATGYLYLVWETLSVMNNMTMDVMDVCFENCRFVRATSVPKKDSVTFHISIKYSSGNFEVLEGNSVIVTGRILHLTNVGDKNLNWYCFNSSNDFKGIEMNTKDVYKELRLRGYHYEGEFRAIQKCDRAATNALVKWNDNWVTFIDNMLQMKILQADTRLLYVPTYISRLVIKAKDHLKMTSNELLKGNTTTILPVSSNLLSGEIRCGGICIQGLVASSIPRRKILGVPLLESYRFVPNFTLLDIHQSLRVNTQIILENAVTYKVTACELIDEFTGKDNVLLMPIIKSALEDQPLIQPFLKIISKMPLEDVTIEVEAKKLNTESDCLLVIGSNFLERPAVLEEAFTALVDNGFIITRESHQYDTSKDINSNLSILTVHRTENETIFLLRKQSRVKHSKYIKISSRQGFSWLSEVQNALTKEKNKDIVLYAENEPRSGIIGLVNCLRREPQSKHVRCMFLMDEAEEFNPQLPFYSHQLKKHMAVNIYKNGQWGTYRSLLLHTANDVNSEHCYGNVTVRGDFSSLRWIEGPLRQDSKLHEEKDLIHVYYCALNFRDVMSALGKVSVDMITQDRLEQECVQGFEYSGRDRKGNRVMGMVTSRALSTLLCGDTYINYPVPDHWTLEEAATVPVVYGTVIYSLVMRGQMTRGESILIHSGTGGIGQAAIKIALHYGCKVFTTVKTEEKRDFLKKTFPQLKDHNIGNSHDESFEQLILRGTNGRGVDLVLNSLAEEKLVASVRCLARGGRFIEIGKLDMAQNRHLSTLLFQKEASFQGVMLDQLFTEMPQVKQKFTELIMDGIKYGAITPLIRTVFKYNELEKAFRFMSTGKHMGKVLIQLRKPEKELVISPTVMKFPGIARFFCDSDKVYIITGGLGGFGLELADWLILRGARKLVLTSRKGVTTGYQNYRMSIWRNYGTVVKIFTGPVTREGCKQLIEESLQLGRVDAIFNLAVVLADAVFENQTEENFVTSFGPKAYATEYLDELTRQMCSDLSEFVVFSSVSCGRGNAGQTNYGMSNSVMERICEDRKLAGYPALAIEWGAIGEVGLVAEMLEDNTEIEISGTLQQKISSCLQVMDTLLRQRDAAIVSSIVVAEKRALNSADNVVDAVINILGIIDSKSVSLHSTLAELGMDSMTAVEIKQVLERDFEVFLSAKDMRTMTLAKLKDIQNEKILEEREDKKVARFGIDMVVRLIGNEVQNSARYVQMQSKVPQDAEAPTLLLFPGIEGFVSVYQNFTETINAHTIGVQLNLDNDEKTIGEMAESVMPTVMKYFVNNQFALVSYSYGTLVALEVVNILESRGYSGILIVIDGAPLLMKSMLLSLEVGSKKIFETAMMCHLLSFYMSNEEIVKHKENLYMCPTWDERVNLGIKIVQEHHSTHNAIYQRLVANSIYQRIQALMVYTPSYTKLKTNVKLIKPSQASVKGLPDDYGLSEYFEKPVEVHTFEGDHVTILENEGVTTLINSCLQEISEGI